MMRMPFRFLTVGCCLGLGILLLGCERKPSNSDGGTLPSANPQNSPPEKQPASPQPDVQTKEVDDSTSTGAVRLFLLGIVNQDEAQIRKVILPHPDAWVLWAGEKPPAAVLAQAKADPDFIICRVIAEGETLTLPGNRTYLVKQHEANENKQIVQYRMAGEKAPLPLRVSRIDGRWKVDASSMIDMRLKFIKPKDDRKKAP